MLQAGHCFIYVALIVIINRSLQNKLDLYKVKVNSQKIGEALMISLSVVNQNRQKIEYW